MLRYAQPLEIQEDLHMVLRELDSQRFDDGLCGAL
jgi:hypothetical protein